MPSRCCIGNCNSLDGNKSTTNLHFYYIKTVKKNPKRFQEWCSALNCTEEELSKKEYICSLHFCDDDYNASDLLRLQLTSGRYRAPRLKDGAVPHLNLPSQSRKRKSDTDTQIPVPDYICSSAKWSNYELQCDTSSMHDDCVPSLETAACPSSQASTYETDSTVDPSHNNSHETNTLPNLIFPEQPAVSTNFHTSICNDYDNFDADFYDAVDSCSDKDVSNDKDITPSPTCLYNETSDEERTGSKDNFCDDNLSDKDSEKKSIKPTIFLCYLTCLLKLFEKCHICGALVTEKKESAMGTMVTITTVCSAGHRYFWYSQTLHDEQPSGNIAVASAIYLSGITCQAFQRFATTLNLSFVSKSSFNNIVKKYIMPVIKQTWFQHHNYIIAEAHKEGKLKLIGDGKHNSTNFSTKYCIYTIMNAVNSYILDFIVVQKGMVQGCLEKAACELLLTRLVREFGNKIDLFLTDRHHCISCMMKTPLFNYIQHEYDIWHLCKSFTKEFTVLCKQFPILSEWKACIMSHIWWCASTCNGDGKLLVEKFKSVLNHVRNIHKWKDGIQFKGCEHKRLTKDAICKTKWLGVNHHTEKEYVALQRLINNKPYLKDLENAKHFDQTGKLEAYHTNLLVYTQKGLHISYNDMVIRSILAVLDHNHNVAKKVTRETEQYSKVSNCCELRNKYETNSDEWRLELLSNIMNYATGTYVIVENPEYEALLFPVPKTIAPI